MGAKVFGLIFAFLIILNNSHVKCGLDPDDDYEELIKSLNTENPTTRNPSSVASNTEISKQSNSGENNIEESNPQAESGLETLSRGSFDVKVEGESPDECELNQKCVPFYLCKKDGDINTDGDFLIDERLDSNEPVGHACPELQQCCRKSDVPSPIEMTLPARIFEIYNLTSDNETITPDIAAKLMCHDPERFPRPQKCGFHNQKGLGGTAKSAQGKINYAQYGEFPWMVVVLVQKGDKLVFQCGGSLIAPNVVLTSGHNLNNVSASDVTVRAGEWEMQSTSEMCDYQERTVRKIVTHEKFIRKNQQNNLSLMFLEKPFGMSAHINTVCLPPKDATYDAKNCISGGWGKDKFGKKGVHQLFPKKVELSMVEPSECQKIMRTTRLGADFKLHRSIICSVGLNGKDVCTGDGGSHLICPVEENSKHFYQVGIVSGGIGCGSEGIPGFYVNVQMFRDWIDDKMHAEGIGSKTYSYE